MGSVRCIIGRTSPFKTHKLNKTTWIYSLVQHVARYMIFFLVWTKSAQKEISFSFCCHDFRSLYLISFDHWFKDHTSTGHNLLSYTYSFLNKIIQISVGQPIHTKSLPNQSLSCSLCYFSCASITIMGRQAKIIIQSQGGCSQNISLKMLIIITID